MSKEVKRKETSGDPAKVGRVFGGFDFGGDATGFSATPEICAADGTCIPADELEGVEAFGWDDLSAAAQKAGTAFFKLVQKEIGAQAFPVA